ncbi:MAG: cbb3-type cytochrome c oxidase subunit I [Chlamydiales bacterium]|nr:cbb3-type cytochrome c oxidase subunit I [Chlamydiales bacterium]
MESAPITATSSKFEDLPVKLFIYPAIIFMVIGMFVGVFISFNGMVVPDYWAGEYIHFGRIRPVHVGHVLFLWLLPADLGLLYYITQRLCGIQLWSRQVGIWSAGIYWLSAGLGVYSFPFGTNWGWEYAEFPVWLSVLPIKFLIFVAFGLVSVNIFMTIANRKYEKMYVSLWYTMGALLWGPLSWIAGNFALDYIPNGISRVNMSFFYVHNLVGLIFTPMGLATAFYFLPKLSKQPIYSHKLSMIGFWSIAFVYAWVGSHHIIHGPMSQWIQTVAIIFSVWLFIPVWTACHNLFFTLRNAWGKYNEIAAVRFIIMGTLFYLMGSTQGSFMALRNVNEITSKTDWIIGHAHITLYGTFTFFAMAGIYGALPALTGKPLYSKRMADWHFTLNLLGASLMFLVLHVGGFLQGLQWASWADGDSYRIFQNNLSKLSFVQTVADMHYFWLVRTISGLIIFAGNLIFVFNVFNTVLLKPASLPPKTERLAAGI